jgi:hypothetical protein
VFLTNLERIFLNFFSERIQRLASLVRHRAERIELLIAKEFEDDEKDGQVEEKQIFENSFDDWKFRTRNSPPQDWLDRVRAGAPELLSGMPELTVPTDSANEVLKAEHLMTPADKTPVINEKNDFVNFPDKNQKVEQISEAPQEFSKAREKTSESNFSALVKPKKQEKVLLFDFKRSFKKHENFVDSVPENDTKKRLAQQQSDRQDESGRNLTRKTEEKEAPAHALSSKRNTIEKDFNPEISNKQKPLRFIFESKEETKERVSSQNFLQEKSTTQEDQIRRKQRFEELKIETDYRDEKQITLLQKKPEDSYSHKFKKQIQNNRKTNWQPDNAPILNERSAKTNNSLPNHEQQAKRLKVSEATDFPVKTQSCWVELPEETIVSESDEFTTLFDENKRLQNLESEQIGRL